MNDKMRSLKDNHYFELDSSITKRLEKEGCATWDEGNSTWGGRAKVFGIVPVCLGVQERARVREEFWREGLLRGTVGLVRV
nr:hypothetical protein [Tanacetum cinerariifolium]